jgi:carbon storage regulator CsrA
MLVLGRKVGERIVIPHCGLTITVSAIHRNTVRLAFSAPPEIDVYREEIWLQRRLQAAGSPNPPCDRASAIPGAAEPCGNQEPA